MPRSVSNYTFQECSLPSISLSLLNREEKLELFPGKVRRCHFREVTVRADSHIHSAEDSVISREHRAHSCWSPGWRQCTLDQLSYPGGRALVSPREGLRDHRLGNICSGPASSISAVKAVLEATKPGLSLRVWSPWHVLGRRPGSSDPLCCWHRHASPKSKSGAPGSPQPFLTQSTEGLARQT